MTGWAALESPAVSSPGSLSLALLATGTPGAAQSVTPEPPHAWVYRDALEAGYATPQP
jgi:hypothetical protein